MYIYTNIYVQSWDTTLNISVYANVYLDSTASKYIKLGLENFYGVVLVL